MKNRFDAIGSCFLIQNTFVKWMAKSEKIIKIWRSFADTKRLSSDSRQIVDRNQLEGMPGRVNVTLPVLFPVGLNQIQWFYRLISYIIFTGWINICKNDQQESVNRQKTLNIMQFIAITCFNNFIMFYIFEIILCILGMW